MRRGTDRTASAVASTAAKIERRLADSSRGARLVRLSELYYPDGGEQCTSASFPRLAWFHSGSPG